MWLALLVCTASVHAAVVVIDDVGQRVALAHAPTRIVSTAPGATEMLFAAGAGRYVIATVEYSDEPAQARRVPRIGDGFAIDLERVIALHPDVMIVWPGGGNPAQIAKLKELGLPIYRQQVDSLADLPVSLRRLGALAGTQTTADLAARDIESRLAALSQHHGRATPLRVFMQVWNHPVYTVGGHQLMTDALRYCGARNIFDDLGERGPAVDVEAVIARDPDVIIAVAQTSSAREWLEDWKRFPKLRAVRNGHLIAFEDRRLSRLGPSVVAATEALCKALPQS